MKLLRILFILILIILSISCNNETNTSKDLYSLQFSASKTAIVFADSVKKPVQIKAKRPFINKVRTPETHYLNLNTSLASKTQIIFK